MQYTLSFTFSFGSQKCGKVLEKAFKMLSKGAWLIPLVLPQVRPALVTPTKPQHGGWGEWGVPTKGSPVEKPIFLWHLVNSILK